MAIPSAVTGTLSIFYQDSQDPSDFHQVERSTHRLLAPSLDGSEWIDGKNLLLNQAKPTFHVQSRAFALLRMTEERPRACPVRGGVPETLRFTQGDSRLVPRTRRISRTSNGLLKGTCPPVQDRSDGANVRKYVERAKDRTHPFRLSGFGHRVYHHYDPRATILKRTCDHVLTALGVHDPLLNVAKHLEDVTPRDDFFLSCILYPNVDFYSGVLYKAIGVPVNTFTVLFAIGRLPGGIAHWREMMQASAVKIGRPQQL